MHLIPIICSVYNFIYVDAVLKFSHAKGLISIGMIYFFVNFLATKAAGEVLYPFLNWQDWWTFVSIVAL